MIEVPVLARVATDQDEEFLKDLFFEVRFPEFEPANLPEAQLRTLLAQQYDAMRDHYSRAFPDAVYQILERDGTPIGYEAVREGEEIHLIDIALRENQRNQGIGTSRMNHLLETARLAGKSVILSVEVFNPARRLYERLGFEEYEQMGMYKRMRWNGREPLQGANMTVANHSLQSVQ